MDAKKRSLGQLFDPSIRLVVPLFQRPYVWEQEKNWEPLWDSIQDVAERRLQGGMQRPYFLGAVVLDRLKTLACDIDARQVIDGQQRMTTFQIALAATRDLCRSLGDEPFSKKFATLTGNASSLCVGPDDVFKVWPTNENRPAYRNVMMAGCCEEVCKLFGGKPDARSVGPDNLIANAYLFFYYNIAAWLGPNEGADFGERLRALWQTLKDDMHIVVIDLDENDDAQVIFETLNALGTPLQPADLIKNFLFQSSELRTDNIERLYEKFWKPFDKRDFWRAVVGQGRLKRPRIDQFLQHYLTLVKGNEVPASHLFAEFREYADDNPTISPADHLRELHTYGSVFEKFQTGYDQSSREGQFFYRLEELETTTFFPLLLEVFKSADQHPPQEITTVLTDLESFVMRRMVCGLTTKGYNRLVLSLIQKLRAGDRFSANAIREFLQSQDAESTYWPTDEQFQRAWLTRSVYEQLTRGRVRIVLEALELALHNEKAEKVIIESNLTIEHVMPQAWPAHWPLPSDLPADQARERREQLVHTFGNLTLVTGKLNPSMSNSGWEMKKKALSEHGAFTLNRQLCGLDAWDDAAIERRSGELFNLAKTIWPRPLVASVIGESAKQGAVAPVLTPSSSQDETNSHTEQEGEQNRPPRHGLRKRFWQGLISRAKAKNTRHGNIAPSEYSWIAAGSGVRGCPFTYAIGQDEGRVELFMDRGAGKTEENKRMFDWLHKHKSEIEQAFGGELSWLRLDDKQACRIAHPLTVGGYRSDESKWPGIQDAMIEAMTRLENALTPLLPKLNAEFAS